MLSIRIVAWGAIVPALLLVSGMTAGAAMAQTADGGTAGAPLQLLRNIKQTHSAKASTKTKVRTKTAARSVSKSKTASKTASRTSSKTKTASRSRAHARMAEQKQPAAPAKLAQAAPAPAPATSWPGTPPAPSTELASPPVAVPPQPSASTLQPSELVVGGQEVRVASPDKVNEIDLAAANNGGAVANDAQALRPQVAAAEPTPKADSTTIAVAQTPTSPVGSTAWIMQVLAALGGAVAAGSVAWFLIGSAPQRTYG
jgi:hypothetical protein